jgi:hypothetical protein
MTDEQAAEETVRQFYQALIDKDYKKVGLIWCGELEEYAKEEWGRVNVTAIVSIGPAIPQPEWDKHGFRVPCELEIINSYGRKTIWKPGPYVRPGDDEMHPDRWNITGGIGMPMENILFVLGTLIGLVIFLGVLAFLVWHIWRKRKQKRKEGIRPDAF